MSTTYTYSSKQAADAAASRYRAKGYRVKVSRNFAGKWTVRTEGTSTSGRKR